MKSIMLENRDQEVIMIGQYVCICWNVYEVNDVIKKDGIEYKAKIYKRESKPYIDFLCVRKDDKKEIYYCDEDNPVIGGLNILSAQKIISELQIAVKYLEKEDIEQLEKDINEYCKCVKKVLNMGKRF